MMKRYTETKTHVLFLHGPFSNFAKSDIIVRDVSFKYTENAFMYLKALAMNDLKSAEKLKNTNLLPFEAKKIGQAVTPFDPLKWTDSIAYSAMLEVNKEKYKIPYYNKLLKDTNQKVMVECNGKDTRWGIGMYENNPNATDESKWKGKNLLGKVLMEIRKTML